jgi:hypothetical protein
MVLLKAIQASSEKRIRIRQLFDKLLIKKNKKKKNKNASGANGSST